MSDHIKIYPFHTATVEWKNLSTHGGDEDWIVLIPKDMDSFWVRHLIETNRFNSEEHILENEDILIILAH